MKLLVTLLITLLFLTGCKKETVNEKQQPPQQILRVGTLYAEHIYTSNSSGRAGFDYELAHQFADHLGKVLQMRPYNNIDELYAALENNKIDIIAASLVETSERRKLFRVSPPLYKSDQLLIYRRGIAAPKNLDELDYPISINSLTDTLIQLQEEHPQLQWQELNEHNNIDILTMIDIGQLHYTLTDSMSFNIYRRFMPELEKGPVLKEDVPIVWLLSLKNTDKLMSELLSFWHQQKELGLLSHLTEKYFGHVDNFDYVDTRIFIKAIKNKLPKYQPLFELYAENLNWQKLAAMSYQESHWNPLARSPTGVRGMMMLTRNTAKYINVKNRLDAEQSIRGGADYLRDLLKRLPSSIPEEEEMWFALAAYNVGLGHVIDAMKIAEQKNLNPNAWQDLKLVLPLLQQRKYHEKTEYGYARGKEAVHYVNNIRRYYDTLTWFDNPKNIDVAKKIMDHVDNTDDEPIPLQ